VLLLPFMEQNALFDRWDKTQAWDSPQNLPLSQTVLKVFVDPSGPAPTTGRTDYLFVTGTGTAFDERPGGHSLAGITDGTANTLYMIEVANSGINWAEPRDVDFSQPMALPPSNHPGVTLGALYDGSVRAISKDIPPEEVRAMATEAGMEPAGAW
jgi:hypothetical protein